MAMASVVRIRGKGRLSAWFGGAYFLSLALGCAPQGESNGSYANQQAPLDLAEHDVELPITMPYGVDFSDVAIAANGNLELGSRAIVSSATDTW